MNLCAALGLILNRYDTGDTSRDADTDEALHVLYALHERLHFDEQAAERYAEMIGLNRPMEERRADILRIAASGPVQWRECAEPPLPHNDGPPALPSAKAD